MAKRQFVRCLPVRRLHISRVLARSECYIPKDSHYDTLGLPYSASTRSIKARFYELSKKYHPDRNKEPSASEKFLQVSEAYGVIGNTSKRKDYDVSIRSKDQGYSRNPQDHRNQAGGRPASGLSRRKMRVYRSPLDFSTAPESKYTQVSPNHFNYDRHYMMHYKHEQLQKQRRYSRQNHQKMHDTETQNAREELNRVFGVSIIILSVIGITGFVSYITSTKKHQVKS
ncbi:DnaJ subfamily B member 9 [Neolecta irregularis DAH-3]|uniref:DnaJ subfamily B member 9 n=1 Tax=Neolecta irregularis (strain DAH-3) TaxID=1198029 RepID=A0A1U7LJ59_NEOID|nr:DnaJ subfamily B member 9 [Neolecta irregularis DAH-3]|eukprot:OLL22561.1 DnaJ subfamily B member 9 [Neolecta irregularis DAH-3]